MSRNERTDRDTARHLIRSLTWGQAIVTCAAATRGLWIRWLHLDQTLTRFALDRGTVDAFALTALPLNTILRTLVATRISYKRIQMLNMLSSIACYRIRFDSFESGKNKNERRSSCAYSLAMMEKTLRFLAECSIGFFIHRFIYRNLIRENVATEILLLEDKAKYGFRKKKHLHLQMLVPS